MIWKVRTDAPAGLNFGRPSSSICIPSPSTSLGVCATTAVSPGCVDEAKESMRTSSSVDTEEKRKKSSQSQENQALEEDRNQLPAIFSGTGSATVPGFWRAVGAGILYVMLKQRRLDSCSFLRGVFCVRGEMSLH